ncbi:hypothetical protein IFM89_009943 [Coptis chinensis]|uniref:SHSP domain-containing protein n=1 Tax=Coptis chinensis TaxID=261450 RepID=A0A835HJ99_9MAGN|nr:hypothetical protein IFM89_009943 [Coptis chinensis]
MPTLPHFLSIKTPLSFQPCSSLHTTLSILKPYCTTNINPDIFRNKMTIYGLRSAAPAAKSPGKKRMFFTDGTVVELEDYTTSDDDEYEEDDEYVFDPLPTVADPPLHASPTPFSADVSKPISKPRSTGQAFNKLDEVVHPFLSPSCGRKNWSRMEDKEALHLRIDMPGLGKEDVKVSVEDNILIIKGEEPKEVQGDNVRAAKIYSHNFVTPTEVYKVDQIKAEMKNGVLMVIVPKVKYEEKRENVVQVNVV